MNSQEFPTFSHRAGQTMHQHEATRGVNERFDADVAAVLSAARDRLIAAAERRKRRDTRTREYYGGRDQLEETLHAIASAQALDAVVTRNHYGCLVLNAPHTLFIDVDVLEPGAAAPNQAGRRCEAPWQTMLDDLRIVLASERNEGFRIYRTAAGFRVLATANEFEPDSHHARQLLEAAGADAAFVDLCRIQNSFRARLTPKPWRCGARRPPNFYPRASAAEQRRFAAWLSQYERACRNHATCRYLEHVGPEHTHERVAPVIELHDRETKALDPLPLA